MYFVWILVPCTRLLEFVNIFYEDGKETLTYCILKTDTLHYDNSKDFEKQRDFAPKQKDLNQFQIQNPFFAKGFQILSKKDLNPSNPNPQRI